MSGMSYPALPRLLAMVAAGAILVGCSSFRDEFVTAAAQPPSPGSLEGAWTGTWKSDVSDHGGKLDALVTRTGPSEYHVRYRAEYKVLWTMTFEHETVLRGHFSGATFHFEGDADLGWLYGTYQYSGYMTGQEFFSTYRTSGDEGVYHLQRPAAEPAAPVAARSASHSVR
jgi:hypothetical protein